MRGIMKDFSFRWTCPRCEEEQPEYIVDGSPCLEVVCERCGEWSAYEQLSEVERAAWDKTREEEAIQEGRL